MDFLHEPIGHRLVRERGESAKKQEKPCARDPICRALGYVERVSAYGIPTKEMSLL